MIPKKILERAKKIKLLVFDVDGVLTGGEIIILDNGQEIKIWSVKDRMGFAMLKHSKSGIKMAWLTARKSDQVQKRGEEIGVHYIRQGLKDKWAELQAIAAELNLKPSEIAYCGDDYVDYKAMKNVGLAVCPPDTPELLKKICHYQTKAEGGKGVAREMIEILLHAQNHWKKTMEPLLSFLVIAGLSLFISACSPSQKAPLEMVEKPDQWVEQFKITETQAGIPVWILNSEIAQIYNKQKKITLENFKIEFMDVKSKRKSNSKEDLTLVKKNLTTNAQLEAPKGEVNTETKDLSAWGGVKVETQDGTTLTSERLQYSTKTQKITTESAVKIVRKDSILIGEGMEASPDLSTVKILRHQASIYPKNITQ